MGKFNTKKVGRQPTAINEMGERAYVLDPKEELVTTLLTTFMNKSYYESEKTILNRLSKALAQVDTEFAAKACLYIRREANMRTSSHWLAGELAPRISGTEWGSRFYDKVCVRPDDMSEIASYYLAYKAAKSTQSKYGRKAIPNAMKKGFKSYLEKIDGYQMINYQMKGRELTLIDLVNMCRPTPSHKMKAAFKALMNGEDLTPFSKSKHIMREMSKAGPSKKAKTAAIKEVVGDKKVGMMALLRNLRNILQTGDFEIVYNAIEMLMNPKKVQHSRLLPFRFVSAYNAVADMESSASRERIVTFENESTQFFSSKRDMISQVLAALNKAIELSCANIPRLIGNTAILCDHSGSMRGSHSSGTSLVSRFSEVTNASIGNLFANMLAYSQENIYFGMFNDKLTQFKYNRSKGILDNHDASMNMINHMDGGTENGIYIFLEECIKNRTRVDNLVIFSDMVIGSGGKAAWYGKTGTGRGTGSFQALFKRFKQLNPQCNVLSVNIHQTSGKTVFDKSLNVTQMAGWSEKIFDVLNTSTVGYKELVKTIEKIRL